MEYYNIQFETRVIQALRKDNVNGNTIHFYWDRAPFGSNYILRVVTHNIKTNQNFLMKQVDAPSKAECWDAMIKYIDTDCKNEESYIVTWSDGKGGEHHESHFRGKDDMDVTNKFIHDNTYGIIIDIKVNELV